MHVNKVSSVEIISLVVKELHEGEDWRAGELG